MKANLADGESARELPTPETTGKHECLLFLIFTCSQCGWLEEILVSCSNTLISTVKCGSFYLVALNNQ